MKIKIKELREEAAMTQAELAAVLNTTQRNISNWEKGLNEPDFETLIKIAQYFEVNLDYLFGTDETFSVPSGFSETEKKIIAKVRRLSPEKQVALNLFLTTFSKDE